MVKDDKRGHRGWWWVLPAAAALALVAAAVLMALPGRTPNASAVPECTLTITKTADVEIAPIGGSVVYTLTVQNTGDAVCTTLIVVDALAPHMDCTATTQPTGWTATASNQCTDAAGVDVMWMTAGTLAAGATATFTLTATITSSAADEEAITNQASANADDPEPATLSNIVTVTVNDCDLTISKDSDDDEVGEGGEIVYTINIENEGTADCGDVIITEDIPGDTDCIDTAITDDSDVDIDDAEGCDASGKVTWEVTEGSLDGLEPGDEAEVEMTVELTSGAEDGDDIDNEACVTSDDTDADTEICDTVSVDVEGVATTKTPTPGPTATVGPTATPRPVVPVAPVVAPAPPAPSAGQAPSLTAPITGTGTAAGGSLPLALALGLAGGCLLLLGGAAMLRRPR